MILQARREQRLLNNLRQTESLQKEVRDADTPMDLLLPSRIDSQKWGCISRCKSGSVTTNMATDIAPQVSGYHWVGYLLPHSLDNSSLVHFKQVVVEEISEFRI